MIIPAPGRADGCLLTSLLGPVTPAVSLDPVTRREQRSAMPRQPAPPLAPGVSLTPGANASPCCCACKPPRHAHAAGSRLTAGEPLRAGTLRGGQMLFCIRSGCHSFPVCGCGPPDPPPRPPPAPVPGCHAGTEWMPMGSAGINGLASGRISCQCTGIGMPTRRSALVGIHLPGHDLFAR